MTRAQAWRHILCGLTACMFAVIAGVVHAYPHFDLLGVAAAAVFGAGLGWCGMWTFLRIAAGPLDRYLARHLARATLRARRRP